MEIVWYFSKKLLIGKVLSVFESWQGFNKAPSPGKVWQGWEGPLATLFEVISLKPSEK